MPRFINARMIDDHDANWRTMEYKVQDRFPEVVNLAIHTEGQQNIVFRASCAWPSLAAAKDTTLLGFFKLNRSNPEARQYL